MVDTSTAPYFDDYDPNKNFYQILFQPRRAVQVRELNQIQTYLQDQVSRFGDHIFKDGSMAVPGEMNYNLTYEYVAVADIDFAEIEEILQTNEVILTGDNSGVSARIVQYASNTTTDPVTFYLQYLEGGTDFSRFVIGEGLQLRTSTGVLVGNSTALDIGKGSVLTIDPGIFYINKRFVRSDQHNIIMAKYSTEPSVTVGFRLVEEVVTWREDPSLLENANGSNSGGIGADRIRLTLVPEVHELGATYNRENFIELAKFDHGILMRQVRGPEYNILEDVLARRTYDQAGDYTVSPFDLRIREHLDTGNNGGLYPPPIGEESKFLVGVESGKAYVRGYEIENLTTKYIPVDKAREIAEINNSSFSLPLGNMIVVNSMSTLPQTGSFQQVSFYSDVPASPGSIPAGTVVGSARVRFVEMGEEPGQGYVYLFDIKNPAGENDSSFLSSAKSVYMPGSPAFTGIVASELIDSINYGLVYRLPVTKAKTLLKGGVSDTSFTVKKQYSVVADSNGSVILTAGTNEIFTTPSPGSIGAAYSPEEGPNVVVDATSVATIGGIPLGSTLTLELGAGAAGRTVTVNAEAVKQIASHKTKSVAESTIEIQPGDFVNARASLKKADAFKIISVTQAGNDFTKSYRLIRNITSEYYGTSLIELQQGESLPTEPITVRFQYFVHGPGDFFSVDSYSSIDYGDIPTEVINREVVSMSDVIDFRPRINDEGTGFTGVGSSVSAMPAPFTLIRCDIQHYLPRIDKVYVSTRGDFGVVKGVPGIFPKEPQTPDNTMPLYTLQVPAYTSDVKDINITFINNKRYTMRDIGNLETRISNLEYYTTLTMLENETSSMQIIDPVTGLNRFKNGFLTDNFVDHSVGLFSSQDYKCSISSEDKTLRPEFTFDSVDFFYNSDASSGTVRTGSLITVPYTEKVFIQQGEATGTMNVNPYAVYRWNGTVTLNPSNDTWFDVRYTTPSVTNRIINNGDLVKEWNSWQAAWTGNSTTTSSSSQTLYTIFNGEHSYTSTDSDIWMLDHDRVGLRTTINTTTTTTQSSKVVGDRLVGTSVIPFMRARSVRFSAKGLMPLSRVYAFFDGVDVTEYCQQQGKSRGQPMYCDADGNLEGTFHLPNTSKLQFRVGTKQFTLIDNLDGVRETSLSYATAPYTAKGTIQTRTKSIVATQETTTSTKIIQCPWDPLAQSFFVEQEGGVFLTGVDLFFLSKDDKATVQLEIRNMDGGFPGQEVVPYSTVILRPSEVNTSEDASAATRFNFDSPVYLQDGTEYCFVVMSNSNNYNAFIATMGQKSVSSTAYISKQPYIGVMFKSQNNTTWTEDQMSDLKFTIHSAKFETNTQGIAAFNNGYPEPVLLDNALVSTEGSNEIIVRLKNHGLVEGSIVRISGVDVAPGFDVSELNRTHKVTRVIDLDSYAFNVTSVATTSGSFGGNQILSDHNVGINLLYPLAQELLFEGTNVDWMFKGTTGKSIDGTEVPYNPTQMYSVSPNENNIFNIPLMIPSEADSLDKLSGPAATLYASMTTFNENISPVVDLNRLSAICVSNRINSPEVLDEEKATGGNSEARYLTNVIGLKNAAISLRVYVDVNRPQGSDILMMYRVGNTKEEVEGKKWSYMDTVRSTYASDRASYSEAEYEKEDLSPFSFYQFKVVMTSTSSGSVPSLKRFRGIALGS